MQKQTPFLEFARVCERLKATTSKLQKTAILADFLLSLNKEELNTAALFILGKAFADYDPRTLNVSWGTLKKIMTKLRPNQDAPALTILQVREFFVRIADISGKGSHQRIQGLLEELFGRASELERKYLVKIIFGEMRIGVAEGLLLEGVARAAAVPMPLVRRANMYLGHPGEVARIALQSGEKGLADVALQLFRPVRPMLAELAEDFTKVLKAHAGRTALEYKFDGARVQIHKLKHNIKIYSRHLSDVTNSLPDVSDIFRKRIRAESAIVEGEVVAVDKQGRPLPFQELMRRFRRIREIDTLIKQVPVKLYLFDLFYLNGQSHIETIYLQRFQLLEQICDYDILVNRRITDNEKAANDFLEAALAKGHEGLMAKKLDSDYQPGARGKKWFKIKPAETLDLVITAAEWGSGRRVGWLSNYHLAARGESPGEYFMLGKTFKGLTDEQFKWMTKKLQSLKISETDYTVHVKPEVVVEVAYNEIQRSPHYNSRFALRFARIKRIREDKTPAQADTIARVRQLYEKQFERKGGEVLRYKV